MPLGMRDLLFAGREGAVWSSLCATFARANLLSWWLHLGIDSAFLDATGDSQVFTLCLCFSYSSEEARKSRRFRRFSLLKITAKKKMNDHFKHVVLKTIQKQLKIWGNSVS